MVVFRFVPLTMPETISPRKWLKIPKWICPNEVVQECHHCLYVFVAIILCVAVFFKKYLYQSYSSRGLRVGCHQKCLFERGRNWNLLLGLLWRHYVFVLIFIPETDSQIARLDSNPNSSCIFFFIWNIMSPKTYLGWKGKFPIRDDSVIQSYCKGLAG